MEPHEIIKQIRKSQGKTTYDVSELTGIPQSTISKIENGKRKLEPISIKKIAKALGVQTNIFFDENAESEKESKDYLFEQYLYKLGMEVIYDDRNSRLLIEASNSQYEISSDDLDNFQDKIESFIRFQISELTNKLTKLPKINNKSMPIAAHNDFENDEKQQKLMKEDIDEL